MTWCKFRLVNTIKRMKIIPCVFYCCAGDLEVSEEVKALLPEGYMPVSVKSGQNVPELRQHIERMLLDLTAILQQRQEQQEQEQEEMKE